LGDPLRGGTVRVPKEKKPWGWEHSGGEESKEGWKTEKRELERYAGVTSKGGRKEGTQKEGVWLKNTMKLERL